MAFSFAQTQLMGNVTKDPELRYTPGGTAVLNFSMATNRGVKDETTQTGWKDIATYHNVKIFGKMAEWLAQSLHKGDQVFVVGRPENRSYEKDGQKRYISEVIAETIVPPKAPKVARTNAPAVRAEGEPIDPSTAQAAPTEQIDVDDIPF